MNTELTMENKIEIIILDDDELICEALSLILNQVEEISVVGFFTHYNDMLQALNPGQKQIVLIDMEMHNDMYAGIKACRNLHQHYSSTVKPLILSSHDRQQKLVIEAIEAGACGYISKKASRRELVSAIKVVATGGNHVFSQTVLETIIQQPTSSANSFRTIDLTERQKEVFEWICKGKDTQQIADGLDISIRTVEKHKADIRLRLDIEKDIDFLLYAIRNKYPEIINFLGMELV